jgi:transposase
MARMTSKKSRRTRLPIFLYEEDRRAFIFGLFHTGRLDINAAAAAVGVTRRHFLRLRRRYAEEGIAGLSNQLAGKRSNHALPQPVRDKALDLARTTYGGLAPTQLARLLHRKHRLALHVETLRLWLIEANLWNPRPRKPD